MQQNFNQSYFESKKHPKATFNEILKKFILSYISCHQILYVTINTIEGQSKKKYYEAHFKETGSQEVLYIIFNLQITYFEVQISIRDKIS